MKFFPNGAKLAFFSEKLQKLPSSRRSTPRPSCVIRFSCSSLFSTLPEAISDQTTLLFRSSLPSPFTRAWQTSAKISNSHDVVCLYIFVFCVVETPLLKSFGVNSLLICSLFSLNVFFNRESISFVHWWAQVR